VLSPFSSSRSLPHRRHTPPFSYPLCSCSLIYSIVACIRNGFDGHSSPLSKHHKRSVGSLSSPSPSSPTLPSSPLSWLRRCGSGVHSAGDDRRFHCRLCCCCLCSCAAAGSPPLALSFSIMVVWIFSLLVASPSRPQRFASTVAAPPISSSERPPSPCPKGLLLCEADGVGRCQRCHLLLDHCCCHRFPTLPAKVCSLQQTPPRQSPVCCMAG